MDTNNSNQPVNPPSISTSASMPEHPVKNQRGGLILIIGIVALILVGVVAGGYYFLNSRKIISNQPATNQTNPSQAPINNQNLSLSENGTIAYVFISQNGRVGFLKEKSVNTGDWGGLTRIGELWTIENNQPVRLIDDAPVLDFVWSPDGNSVVYHKYIPSKEQGMLPFIKEAHASGGFAEGDIILYDVPTKQKTVIGKFGRSDWQTPYDLPKWSKDGQEVLFSDDKGIVKKYNISTKRTIPINGVSLRNISPHLDKAIITDKNEQSDTLTIRNLQTGESRVISGLQKLIQGGSVYTYLWSPDNTNLAIIANLPSSGQEDYDTCYTFVFDSKNNDLSTARKMDKPVNTGSCGYGNIQPVWSPNGRYVQLGDNLFSIEPNSYPVPNVKIELKSGGGPSGILNGVTWSPDSTMFADVMNEKLSIYNLKTGKTLTLDEFTSNWAGVGYRAWLPDNSRLIYNANGNLVSVKADGTDKKVLAN